MSTGGRAEPATVVPFGLLLDPGSVPRRLLLVSVAMAVSALRERVNPFGTVHHGRAHRVGGAAGVDQDVVERPERERRIVGRQRPPFAGAVGLELRDIENAVVEWIDAPTPRRAPRQVRYVAVDVLVPLVVAHVDDDLAVLGLLDPRALVLETSERGALDRRGLRFERIDLDDPTESIGLVGIGVGVESSVRRVPAKPGTGWRDAVALFQSAFACRDSASGRRNR